jgi:alanyl-tRNA synthetase
VLYPTDLVYYRDSYQTALKTEIIGVEKGSDGKLNVYLDATIFYPYGGGQPSDQGNIATETGKVDVRNVQVQNGIVRHEAVATEGEISEGQEATLNIDWKRRHWNMRVHTAGHIIHDVLTESMSGLTPGRGDHGTKPYIEYASEVDPSINKEKLEIDVNKVIQENRSIVTRETTSEELQSIAKYIPPNLPKGKPLRIIQIEGFHAMPDGGTQVKQLGEIGKVEILSITYKQGKVNIRYAVHD